MNRISKSSESLSKKNYSNIILNVTIFLTILFTWFLRDRYVIDEKGLTTGLFVLPGTLLFFLLGFIVGIVLIFLRKNRKDSGKFKLNNSILSIVLMVLLILFFINPIVSNLAILTNSNGLCTLLPERPYNLLLQDTEDECERAIAIKTQDVEICSELNEYACNIIARDAGDFLKCRETSSGFCDNYVYEYKDVEESVYASLQDLNDISLDYAIETSRILLSYPENEEKYIEALKRIVRLGNFNSKELAIDVLVDWASTKGFYEEKEILKTDILPLIENQKDMKEKKEYIELLIDAELLPSK